MAKIYYLKKRKKITQKTWRLINSRNKVVLTVVNLFLKKTKSKAMLICLYRLTAFINFTDLVLDLMQKIN